MKVIVSHDVDHLTVWEHNRDLIIPKFLARNLIETFNRTIPAGEMFRRAGALFSNRWQNIEELMVYDREKGIPSTFFFGVANGQYLSYPFSAAGEWIRKLDREGFDTGVHGIAFKDPGEIAAEYKKFSSLLPGRSFGIRMHYVRLDSETLANLSWAGYLFDSSAREPLMPHKIGGMWEFPLHLMDGDVLEEGKRWSHKKPEEVRESTKRIIERVHAAGSPYLTVCFHDRYFCSAFAYWKDWYEWLIGYLAGNGFGFTGFRDAIREMEPSLNAESHG
jgi:hypothetical protein